MSVAPVNALPGVDPQTHAEAMAAGCQTFTQIEAFAWWDRSGACDQAHPGLCTATYRDKRRAFLRAMSAHEITTLVTSMNSNAAGPRSLGDEAFRAHVIEIREDAIEAGLEHVWLGSPSEPWQWDWSRGRRLAEIAREEWPATLVLPDAGRNHATGRPYYSGIAYDYVEVHPCSIEAAFTSLRHSGPVLTVTDCTPVLVRGEPALSELTREALRLERPLLFYDFAATSTNFGAIAAVGREIGGSP